MACLEIGGQGSDIERCYRLWENDGYIEAMMKTALITGITGQDGSYLAELLLEKGYAVHGIKRRASSFNTARIDHLYQDPHESDPRLSLHYGDLTDSTNLIRIIQQVQPDEIYNLGAQSHVIEPAHWGAAMSNAATVPGCRERCWLLPP